MIHFSKLHALGNDFLVSNIGESEGHQRSLSAIASRICNRHVGVGADGIVFYQPTRGDDDAEFSALIFNADGSRAEMSGNGIRCMAAHLLHSREYLMTKLRIRTVSGIKTLTLREHAGRLYRFDCSMGHPILDPARIPVRVGTSPGPILDYPQVFGQDKIHVSLCSMGNPHCSTFWPDIEHAPVERLGPILELDSRFPNRTNVEFIQVIDRGRIKVRFWERGVGRTLSSGTGSSAAAVASILQNLAESPLFVETELGDLSVEWQPGRELRLTGPAEYICCGQYAAGDQPSPS